MPPVPGQHAGILREENIALRQILGYRLESLLPVPPYNLPPISHSLPGTHVKDVLLVAVDVDTGGGYEVISPGQSFHIGVSILDTRHLITTQLRDPAAAISSHQFINTDSRPCRWAARSFLFGDTERIALPDFTTRFARLTAGRAYVLVAHGTREEIKFLNNLDPGIAAPAAYIMDTVKAAQHPLQLYYRYSIEKLLDEFAIPYANLHAAGNDAHFALKALLMIAVRDGRRAPETTAASQELFRTLDAIAHAPVALPVWIDKPPLDANPNKTKLGVKAKRRLKKARREARRILPELPYCGDSDGQDVEGHEEQHASLPS
ncbi:DnaQ-like (or DEDD) 3'-5' exonuclease superfamily protein [Metarhizium robertsii]|uniref:QDE-2-interacting protein n=2 Tax=Metarhizium robertsii TaxID=568076 RepID=E9ELY3_METRA|nr:QDE-2-interacting protein [Metarhizium robertsii ARSEF 23]EFZ03568.1 QDE-2-interacting protein [Metarhizium robertsii ARSEF 23]EXU99978.1 DnaQ-like (or DEDD) 3'-5' exonuclease superfamily protein [Metarhizium robertsii]